MRRRWRCQILLNQVWLGINEVIFKSLYNLAKGEDLEEESWDMEGSSEEEVEMSDLTESGMVRYQ